MIEARGLTKRYGDKLAVDDLTFSVAPGRVTGFLGPNGAGKTTTMRLILGLDFPDGGTATIEGKRYASLGYPMREVGALLDAKAVHGGRSAYNHLLCLAQTNDLPKRRVGVIGRGKLLAETSMEEFIARSSGHVIRVRTPQAEELIRALAEAGIAAVGGVDGTLTVRGLTPDRVGDIAFEHGVRLHELTQTRASLEAAFMELTADSVEYQAGIPGQEPAPPQVPAQPVTEQPLTGQPLTGQPSVGQQSVGRQA